MGTFLGEINSKRSLEQVLQEYDTVFLANNTVMADFYVLSDTFNDTESDLLQNTPGLPQVYGTYYNRTCMAIHGQETSRVVHPVTGLPCGLWEFSCVFAERVDDGSINTNPNYEDPLQKRTRKSWDSEDQMEVLYEDAWGPIVTGCGEQIIVEAPVTIGILTLTRWEPHPYDQNNIYKYTNTINEKTFYGAPRGTVKMKKIKSDETIIQNKLYEEVRYDLAFKMKKDKQGQILQDTWVARILHQGHLYREIGTNVVRVAKINGEPLMQNLYSPTEFPFEEGGYLLNKYFAGSSALPTPQLLKYRPYTYSDFDELNLLEFVDQATVTTTDAPEEE